MFELVEENSLYQIAEILFARGHLTSTGLPWSPARISDILKDPIYKGDAIYRRKRNKTSPENRSPFQSHHLSPMVCGNRCNWPLKHVIVDQKRPPMGSVDMFDAPSAAVQFTATECNRMDETNGFTSITYVEMVPAPIGEKHMENTARFFHAPTTNCIGWTTLKGRPVRNWLKPWEAPKP